MQRFAITLISGYDTADPSAPDTARWEWAVKHLRVVYRRGRWKPEAALRCARRAGVRSDVTITHTSGNGIEARWIAKADGALWQQK